MATVVGKTSIRIDELLQDFLTSLEIGPDGKIISTTRGGLVSNLGTIVLPGDLDTAINQTQVSAQQYADLQINAATTELNDTIAVETQQVRDYSDAQLANEVILINNNIAAVDSRVDSTDAAVDSMTTALFDVASKANAAGRIYFQTSAPAGDVKYLWVDTTGGNNTPKRWNGTTWVVATDKVATDAAAAATALGVRVTDVEGEVTSHESRLVTAEGEIGSHETRITSAEGVITSTSSNVSNLTSTVSSHTTRLTSAEGNITSIDGRVDNAELSINSHETRIGDAEDEITNIVNIQLPGKTKTTYSTNPPGTTANTAGDTWFQKVGGEIIGQWQGGGGTSWIQLTLTDSVVTNLKAGTITSGTFAGDRIGANTIDSTKIVTAGLDAGIIKFGEMEGDRIKAGTLLISKVTNLQTTLDDKATAASVTALSNALNTIGGENLLPTDFNATFTGWARSGLSGTVRAISYLASGGWNNGPLYRLVRTDKAAPLVTTSTNNTFIPTGTVMTASLYVRHNEAGQSGVNIDVSTVNRATSDPTKVGVWQRIVSTAPVPASGAQIRVYVDSPNGTVDDTGVDVSAPQLELGSVATAYRLGSTDIVSRVMTAEITGYEAPWSNVNSTFSDWTGVAPAYFGTWSGSVPIKNTTDAVAGPYAVQFEALAAENEGIAITSSFDAIPLNTEYVTVEVDVLLKSGNFSGAGVLVDWVGTSPVRNSLKLHTIIPSPELSKWYRVTQVLKRSGVGTQTDWLGYLMGNYASDGLGALSAKNIVFDRLGLRPSTQEEITAYNTPGYIATAKTEAVSAAATDATTKANDARANAVSDLKTMWGHPSNQTLIDGGDIYTGTVRAQSIGAKQIATTHLIMSNFDNLVGDPNFVLPNGTGWSSLSSIATAGGPDGVVNAGVLSPNAATIWPVAQPSFSLATENGASYRTRVMFHSDLALPAGVITIRARFVATDGTILDLSGGVSSAASAGTWNEVSGVVTTPSDKTYTRMGYFLSIAPHATQTIKIAEPSMTRAADAKLIVDGSIDGKTITGALVQTSATANRGLKLNATGLLAYDAAGVATLTINATSGAISMKGDLTSGSTITGATMTGGVLQTQPTGTNAKAIRISGNIFTAHDPAGNAVVTINGETGSVALKGELTSGSIITGATYRTAVSGERLEINTSDLSAIKFFSGASQEIESGRITSDVVDEPFPGTPTWTQRRSSLILRSPQINSGVPTAAIELSSVQVIDPFTVEVQPQVNITGTLNASGLSVGTGQVSAYGIYSTGSGGTTQIPGTGFRYTNSTIGDNQNPVLPMNFLGRAYGQLTPIGNAPKDGVRRQSHNSSSISLGAIGTAAKKAYIQVDVKGLYGGSGAAYWHLLVSTDAGASWIPVQENFRAYNYGFNQWDVGAVLSGWVPTMKIRSADPSRQSNALQIRVEVSNDATSGGDLVVGLANYTVAWFG